MATSMPNPQASAPGPPPQGGGGLNQQVNPLQQVLGQIVMNLRQLADQNQLIQPELQQMQSLAIQALQKVSQASSGPPVQPTAPPQQ